MSQIAWDEHFEIDWFKSSHYTPLPPLPIDTPLKDHVYTHVKFCSIELPIDDDFVVRGHWVIANGWCHITAEFRNPEKKHMFFVFADMFKDHFDKHAPMLPAFEPENHGETTDSDELQSLALGDVPIETPERKKARVPQPMPSPSASSRASSACKSDHGSDGAQSTTSAQAPVFQQPSAVKSGVVALSVGVKEFKRPDGPSPAVKAAEMMKKITEMKSK